jgi:hypothetical protein
MRDRKAFQALSGSFRLFQALSGSFSLAFLRNRIRPSGSSPFFILLSPSPSDVKRLKAQNEVFPHFQNGLRIRVQKLCSDPTPLDPTPLDADDTDFVGFSIRVISAIRGYVLFLSLY